MGFIEWHSTERARKDNLKCNGCFYKLKNIVIYDSFWQKMFSVFGVA